MRGQEAGQRVKMNAEIQGRSARVASVMGGADWSSSVNEPSAGPSGPRSRPAGGGPGRVSTRAAQRRAARATVTRIVEVRRRYDGAAGSGRVGRRRDAKVVAGRFCLPPPLRGRAGVGGAFAAPPVAPPPTLTLPHKGGGDWSRGAQVRG